MRLLYRHFLRTFFKSEGVAEGGDPRSLVVAIGGMAASIAVMVCFGIVAMAGAIDPRPLVGFFLTLSMALTAVVATIEWDTLFPGPTDFAVLRPLPLAPGAIFATKLAALITFVTGFVVLTNMFSATLLPVFSAPVSYTMLRTLRVALGQIVATAAGSAWAFFLVMALCGLLLAIGGEWALRRLGPLIQFLAFTASLTTCVLCWYLMSPQEFYRMAGSRWAPVNPILWFVGLDQTLAGMPFPNAQRLAHHATEALLWTGLAALVLFLLGYERRLRASPIADGRSRSQGLAPAGALSSPRRTVGAFAARTLARSRRHQLYLSGWLAAGCALILAGWLELAWHLVGTRPPAVALAALATPLTLVFFILAGLRHAFAVPIAPTANWVFQLALPDGAMAGLAAARHLMWLAVAPVLVATLAVALYVEAWPAALLQSLTTTALALLMIEASLMHFRKLPFTCTYLPDKLNLKGTGMAFCGVFLLYAYGSASLELRLTPHPASLAAAGLLVAGAAFALHALNRHWLARSEDGAQFEDVAEPIVHSLLDRG